MAFSKSAIAFLSSFKACRTDPQGRGAQILRVEEHRLVQVLQRKIEVMLAYMEIPALAIGNSIPRIGAYPRILLADLPIEIDVAVVALRRHVLPLPNHAVGLLPRLPLRQLVPSAGRP